MLTSGLATPGNYDLQEERGTELWNTPTGVYIKTWETWTVNGIIMYPPIKYRCLNSPLCLLIDS